MYGSPKPQLYIGGRGGCAPFRVSHPQGVRPALDGKGGGGQEGEEREAQGAWALGPICPRVCPLPLLEAPWALVGGAPAHIGAGPFPLLAHVGLRGWWPYLVDPRTFRWSRYTTGDAQNTSGGQNHTSYISIFTSGPFRNSS